MSKKIKVSLKDKAKSYEGQDLSLKVFLRGSIALDIKIGGDWNAPDSYDIPYEGGECRVSVERSVKNGIMESKLISLDDPQFAGDYVDVLMSDSSIEPVEPAEVDETQELKVDAIEKVLQENCGDPEDCCGDPEDCRSITVEDDVIFQERHETEE